MSRQHVTETHKKLARLEEEGRKRAEQYEQALQRYRETWSRHQKVYCSFPGVPQIMLLEDEVETLRKKGGSLLCCSPSDDSAHSMFSVYIYHYPFNPESLS